MIFNNNYLNNLIYRVFFDINIDFRISRKITDNKTGIYVTIDEPL